MDRLRLGTRIGALAEMRYQSLQISEILVGQWHLCATFASLCGERPRDHRSLGCACTLARLLSSLGMFCGGAHG